MTYLVVRIILWFAIQSEWLNEFHDIFPRNLMSVVIFDSISQRYREDSRWYSWKSKSFPVHAYALHHSCGHAILLRMEIVCDCSGLCANCIRHQCSYWKSELNQLLAPQFETYFHILTLIYLDSVSSGYVNQRAKRIFGRCKCGRRSLEWNTNSIWVWRRKSWNRPIQ